jgi:hypothetical protein
MTLPISLLDWVTLIAEILGIAGMIIGALSAVYKWGFNNGLKAIRRTNLKLCYENIYAPICGLFTTKHITSSFAVLAPYFSQRLKKATHLVKAGAFRAAIIALFDKRNTKGGAETEYGGVFPTTGIIKIVQGKEAYAEERLLTLISHAHLSRLEKPDEDENVLTDEEFDLFQFAIKRYTELYRIFGPK